MLRFRLDMNFAPQLVSAYSRLEEEVTKYQDIAQKSKKLLNSKKRCVQDGAHLAEVLRRIQGARPICR